MFVWSQVQAARSFLRFIGVMKICAGCEWFSNHVAGASVDQFFTALLVAYLKEDIEIVLPCFQFTAGMWVYYGTKVRFVTFIKPFF